MPGENRGLEHFLKGKGLGAELYFVCTMLLGFPPFIFYGEDGAVLIKLNDVALSDQFQAMRGDREASGDPYSGAGFDKAAMRSLMQHLPFCGKAVFAPFPVEVNESALPFAVEQVLESGDGVKLAQSGRGAWFRSRR